MTEASTQFPQIASILITLGSLFLLGLVADLLGTHTPFPREALLLMIGFGYITLRIVGRLLDTHLGGRLSCTEPIIRRWIGLTLLPQAGVAIGMALLVSQRFPELKDIILPIVLGSTVVFELIGSVVTRRVLIRVGDIKHD